MEKFKWAFIGCGSMAQMAAKVIVASGKHEIIAVFNRTAEKAAAFTGKFGGTAYATAEEAITAEGVQGVYIAVTADKHAEYVKLSIKHHRPTLCEKPFTPNAKTAKELFDEAQAEGVYLTEAMWTWYNDTALKVKEWVEAKAVGDIQKVQLWYAFPILKFHRGDRLTDPRRIGGVLMDCGVYPLRYAVGLFGVPEKIVCRDVHREAVDYSEKIDLSYPGFMVHLVISMEKFEVGEKALIRGSDGTIKVPWFHMGRKAILSAKKKVRFRDPHSITELFLVEFDRVSSEILAGKTTSDFVTPESTLQTLRVMDECRRQMGLRFLGED